MEETENRRPKAIVIHHFFHPDDVVSARHFSQFAEELVKRGWDVRVLTSNRYCRYNNKKVQEGDEYWKGISVTRVYRPGWDQVHYFPRFLNSIWMMIGWTISLLRTHSADVIIIGTDPQFSALLFPLLRFLRRGKILAHWCHDLYPEAIIADEAKGITKWIAQRVPLLMRWAYRSVDLMVDIGACMRKRLERYQLRAKRATLVPWALVEPEYLKEPDLATRVALFRDAKLTLLYSGNMGKAHDFSLFLRLARRLYREDPGIVLCFACRGNRFKELTDAIRPTDYNIRLAPFADESELEKRLNSADIHLLSLRKEWEGIVVPSKFFGSMAVGKPVIYAGPETSAIGGWLREFNLGLFLTEENLDQVAKELLAISNQPMKLHIWQKNTFQAYHKFFSKKNVMDQWDKVLKDLMNEGEFPAKNEKETV